MVSDIGSGDKALFNELQIDHLRLWINNRYKMEKIYVFADVPHLIKLIRKCFVNDGFLINGVEINKKTIEELLHLTVVGDLTITNKIAKENLNVRGSERQKVKLASTFFSHTISGAL